MRAMAREKKMVKILVTMNKCVLETICFSSDYAHGEMDCFVYETHLKMVVVCSANVFHLLAISLEPVDQTNGASLNPCYFHCC